MYISKVVIENYKCFDGTFSLSLNKHLNILVGDNEVGKSTVIEAINLALTGLFNGRYLKSELNQYLFNNNVVEKYFKAIENIKNDSIPIPPEILIEIYFDDIDDDSTKALFEGNGNTTKQKACGVQFRIALSESYKSYYEELTKNGEIKSLPIEYYDFHWSSFARDETVTPALIPIKPALIDSSNTRYSNGSDVYISRILRDRLEDTEKNSVSQAYRKFRDSFDRDPAIMAINEKIQVDSYISEKRVELSVDVSSKNAWETTLTTYLDKVPFHYVGKGEQTLVKTKLALGHKRTKEASVLLIEEPENHLSHTKLNRLIEFIKSSNEEKQIILSTHSSFVANKLNLGNLILFNNNHLTNIRTNMSFNELSSETREYFEHLSGYDTLRLILCKSSILVEGDSDELVVKRAYMDSHLGKLPIEEEKEIISVGTAFLRFLEIASKLNKQVAVVTDNDSNIEGVKDKYKNYLEDGKNLNIKICFDSQNDSGNLTTGKENKSFNYNTLEPKLVKENGLELINKILEKSYNSENDLHKYMMLNKTECALKIFKSNLCIKFPKYINDAIDFVSNESK